MSFLYRCKCGKRRALPRLHTAYIRAPKCHDCKSLLTYRDVWQEKRNKLNTCLCDGAAYPHQAGSTLFCVESKALPTHEQFANYYGVKP